ncbi:PqqD family protein, partial [bacterium]|nr:PqqD family protein [bacterium]MDY2885887.1 PqqD family protein [Bariatricus sp.]
YVIVPVDEECMISNAVMSPNDSAVFFWKVFQTPHTKEDAVRKGMQEYDVEEETIRSAVYRFLKDTLKYKIIEEVD